MRTPQPCSKILINHLRCLSPLHGDGDGHVDGSQHEEGVQRVEQHGEGQDVRARGQREGAAERLNDGEEQVRGVHLL